MTLACVTKARGGGELPRFRVRSVLFELPSSPDATMFDERGAVRSNCDSRSKLFRGCQYTQSSYLRVVLSISEGRQGAASITSSSATALIRRGSSCFR